jgi:hypothetical protein
MARFYTPIPDEFLEEMQLLGHDEFGRLVRWMMNYNITGIDDRTELTGNEVFYVQRCLNVLKRYKENFEDVSTARSEAGKKGAAARWNDGNGTFANGKNGKAILPYSKNSKNGYINTNTNTDNSPTIVGGINKTHGRAFVPPSYDEVAEYCRERGNNVDAQGFVDFYTAKGWMVGKNRMKDWRAAVRNWERSETVGKRAGGSSPPIVDTPEENLKNMQQLQRLREKMRQNDGG